MAGGYRVDLDQMGTLITTLQQAKEQMTNANKALGESSPNDMGSRDIDAAGGEFQDRWNYGIGKIAEFSGAVVDGLTKAKQAYADMETNTAQAFAQSPGDQAAPPAAAPAPPVGQSPIADRLGEQHSELEPDGGQSRTASDRQLPSVGVRPRARNRGQSRRRRRDPG